MTYTEITPESAEQGEFSDCGFIWEGAHCTFSELVDYVKKGFTDWSNSDKTGWLSTGFSIDDYRTMTERQEELHANNERSFRYLKKAYNFATGE